MGILCSSNGIIDFTYARTGVTDIANANFSCVALDLSKYCMPEEIERWGKFEIHNSLSKKILENPALLLEEAINCQKMLTENNIKVGALIAPYLLRKTQRGDCAELMKEFARGAVDLCGIFKCPYVIVRPIYQGLKQSEENKAFYLSLAELARKNGVKVLLENQCKNIGGHLVRGFCSDVIEAGEWLKELNTVAGGDVFGFCINVEALSLCGQDVYEFTSVMGKYSNVIIASDCTGEEEMHLLPYSGAKRHASQINWIQLLRGLKTSGFEGDIMLDMEDTFLAYPTFLRPKLLDFAYETMQYLQRQILMKNVVGKYDDLVLFGAGNMCKEYMKYLGEKYPPRFTCDNNQERWGSEYCGLVVKSPEELKKLPDHVAIFICNVFYREVAQQLKEMNLKNPIVIFNDVYMQAYDYNWD